MSKNIKIYDNDGKKWDSLISSINTVVNYSGEPITDQDVEVTNPSFADESGNTIDLYEALDQLKATTDKHSRNIAWLAKHGGGGGGGTGGTTYGIYVSSPTVIDSAATVDSSSFDLRFVFTGASSTSIFSYRIALDGQYLKSSYTNARGGVYETVNIPDLEAYSSGAHAISIEAIDPEGIAMTPYVFSVSESSVSVAVEKVNQTITIVEGNVNILVTSKLVGNNVTVNVMNEANTSLTTFAKYVSDSTATKSVPINVLEIAGDNVTPGNTFVFRAWAVVELSNGGAIRSNDVIFRVTVLSGDMMIVVIENITPLDTVSVEGPTKAAVGENFPIVFRPYINTDSNYVYYSIRLSKSESLDSVEGDILIDGRYYDENLKTSEDSNYNSNNTTAPNISISKSWLPTDEFVNPEDEYWVISIRCWDALGNKVGTSQGVINVSEGSAEYYHRQIPQRTVSQGGLLVNYDTLMACWSNQNSNFPTITTADEWVSDGLTYATVGGNVVTPQVRMGVYNVNGRVNGFLTNPETATKYLRHQNESYSIIDLNSGDFNCFTEFKEKLLNSGFTLSITYNADRLPFNDRTVMFMGSNNSATGELVEGIKITLNEVRWVIKNGNTGEYKTISVPVNTARDNTIDFVYDPTKTLAVVYVNGIIGGASDISNGYLMNSNLDKIYLGCDVVNNRQCNFSDVSIYDISFYGSHLNDVQLVVNAKNAKLVNKGSEETKADYLKWRNRNFLKSTDSGSSLDNAVSSLFDAATNSYKNTFNDINESPIPVVKIFYNGTVTASTDTSGNYFTTGFFYSTNLDPSIVNNRFGNFTLSYTDPKYGNNVSFNVEVAIQGTSTTTLRSKNIEIYVDEVCKSDVTKTKLFQPKPSWLPESEFTLKADVVDSSHSNNATLGEWINNLGTDYLDENPAMEAFRYNKPIVTDSGGTSNPTKEATVKHTLEGFPVLLNMQFADGLWVNLGIYSMNLGRYSYYNMGFRFLQEFNRENGSSDDDNFSPCMIDDYTEYTGTLTYGETGKILRLDSILSFEFEAKADENSTEYPTWSQDSLNILDIYGSFRYNSMATESAAMNVLQKLFYVTSRMLPLYYKYNYENGSYIKTSERYQEMVGGYENLVNTLNIKNAVTYFVIATLHGMIDSLGKNLTLRTWNANDETPMWYTCFYDMDSAEGLTNAGDESVAETAYVDVYRNKCKFQYVDDSGQTIIVDNKSDLPHDEAGNITVDYIEIWDPKTDGRNYLVIEPNSKDGGYGAYNSKLWNLIKAAGNSGIYYIFQGNNTHATWVNLRNSAKLRSENDYVSLIEKQMGDCGELLYNLDFNEKYLKKYATSTSSVETYGNINMLHGNRIEYIRQWLGNRICFFDGVFESENNYIINDSVFYKQGQITNAGNTIGWAAFPLTIRTTKPIIMKISTGQGSVTSADTYFIPSYTDTVIGIAENTSQDKRTTINATEIISKLDGLYNIGFQKFENISLPSMTEINIRNTSTLSSPNPINFDYFGKDMLTTVDLSNTSFKGNVNGSFDVALGDFTKITYIDVSNSCVTSMSIPTSVLNYLNVNSSNIQEFNLSNQPALSSITASTCKNLTSANISNCDGIKSITLNNDSQLSSVVISNLPNVTAVTLNGNVMLSRLQINNCPKLSILSLSGCSNANLDVQLINVSGLTSLNFAELNTTNRIKFNSCDVSLVASLNLNGWYNTQGFEFDGSYLTYKGEAVLDLSNFGALKSSTLGYSGLAPVKYIKVGESEENPFLFDTNLFNDASNITRIFGYFDVGVNNLFNNCSKFKFNDDNDSDEFKTHISFSTADVSGTFSGTSVDGNDVIEIMESLNSGVTNISSMFSVCRLDGFTFDTRQLFENCRNVSNMNELFYRTGGEFDLYGTLLNEDGTVAEEGTFYHMSNLTVFNSVFRDCLVNIYDFYPYGEVSSLYSPLFQIDDFKRLWEYETGEWLTVNGQPFNSDGIFSETYFNDSAFMNITSISDFNPRYFYESEDTYNCCEKTVLYFLPKVTSYYNAFNNCFIFDAIDGYELSDDKDIIRTLFNHVSSVTTVESSFRGIINSIGDELVVDRILWNFTSLRSLSSSFAFKPEENGDATNVALQLTGGFIPSTLTSYTSSDRGEYISFNGIDRKWINGVSDINAMFENTRLTVVEGIFTNVKCDSTINVADIHFPQNVTSLAMAFLNCGFNYTVTRGCLSGYNRLTNIAYIFAKNNNTMSVPFGLFSGCSNITDASYAFSGHTVRYEMLEIPSDLTPEALLEQGWIVAKEGGEYAWNEKFYDATINGINKINTIYEAIKNDITIDNPSDVEWIDRDNANGYVCPPDILDYFQNGGCGIDGMFCDCTSLGMIPTNVFSKQNLAKSLSFFFKANNVVPSSADAMFSTEMFSEMTGLEDISGIFANITFTKPIPNGLFTNNQSIKNASYLFSGCTFNIDLSTYSQQMPSPLFENANQLTNIGAMFAKANGLVLTASLFGESTPNINDATLFAGNAVNMSGTAVRLWEFKNLNPNNAISAYSTINESNCGDFGISLDTYNRYKETIFREIKN